MEPKKNPYITPEERAAQIPLQRVVMPFIGVAKCENCALSEHEFDGDFGTIDCGWYCTLHLIFHEKRVPHNFPFLKAPDCFLPDFWLTSFADCIPDDFDGYDPENILQEAYLKYMAHYRSA